MVTRALPSKDALWRVAGSVLDPEVPALSVVDIGIVRDIRVESGTVIVDVTPTYSGCPAMDVIASDLETAFRSAGAERVVIRTVLEPAWTTDWLTDEAKVRLRASGIAPPGKAVRNEGDLIQLRRRPEPVACPYCGSDETEIRSAFGSTACKAICFCRSCTQPFDYFKPL